ncbi:MAG: hypothetical protein AAFR61_21635 [Bacteroidota bacterium]
MTNKSSIRASLSGLGASSLTFLGLCCGGGLCAVACAAPVASILGVSSAGLAQFTQQYLPLLAALSAAAFTVGYYQLYRMPKEDCCGPDETPARGFSWAKSLFWVGLVLSVGFYGQAMYQGREASGTEGVSCVADTSEASEKGSQPGCEEKGSGDE